jgi:NADH dehydrogenase
MILLTGATGSVGTNLLPLLLERGERIKCLVREPAGLGRFRVDVQITMGDLRDLSDPYLLRQALRGVDTVIHLAGSMRDQPPLSVEQLNGLATARLVDGAEALGIERFMFFSALGAGPTKGSRFLRSKWVGEEAVQSSPVKTTVFMPSIVFDRSDPWVTLMERFSFLPFMPVAGRGTAEFQPVWAHDAARAVVAVLDGQERETVEVVGPQTQTYAGMSSLVAELAGRPRPVWPIPKPLIYLGLEAVRAVFGQAAFATWEEAQLMQSPMISDNGTRDMESLGITPHSMGDVLTGQA